MATAIAEIATDPLVGQHAGALLSDLATSGGTDFLGAVLKSLVVILVTEIGDKTFFIAAVLAMRHGRLVVYCGAMGALAIMHILSVLMGFALPSLLPKRYTHAASIILFLYFGYRLLKDASEMEGGKPSDELLEVEEELINKKSEGGEEDEEDDVEGGNGGKSAAQRPSKTTGNLTVFTQAFTLTFLAEWGDRSQIATIALAASKNPYGVVLGGLVGHAFCTGVAVVGGRLLAARISEKAVATIGGILFFMFAIHSFLFGPENS